MYHTKFENNWSSGYQEEVKNVQMLTDDGQTQIAIGCKIICTCNS
jgi:hypothetical protein